MQRQIYFYNLKDLPNKLIGEEGIHKTYYFYHKGSITKEKIEIDLSVENAIVGLKGVIVGEEKNNITLSTITQHKKGNNNARVHIKAVLQDSVNFDFEGMIKISEDAQLSDSYLQQDNLITSDGVVCNSTPQLEIGANDVKASHGVTIGSFDINQLFYLQSRGLTEKASKELLSEGFLLDVFGQDVELVKKNLKLVTIL